ncbi:ferritin-like domain-containing protein [Chitinimonas taiwanensis]|uniref:ferritin-like domain-containing protein n=1 Tax=Chitinimonas taiwanensis TaxID=240412 RepID=UPI0035B22F49
MSRALCPAVCQALATSDPSDKAAQADALWAAWQAGELNPAQGWHNLPAQPGRPARPALLPPAQVPQRKLGSLEGRAALLHAICHIEFNAINLALDAAARFAGLPTDYYGDWLRVAAEEAGHFRLLRTHLASLGYQYGDFPAHNSLWEMAERTQGDVLARMALVPRLLEARGLDVTPGMQARLLAAGDPEAVAILDIIFRDEVGHVAVGNRWFRHLCTERGLDPVLTFRQLLPRFKAPRQIGTLNEEARRRAGFQDAELDALRDYAANG